MGNILTFRCAHCETKATVHNPAVGLPILCLACNELSVIPGPVHSGGVVVMNHMQGGEIKEESIQLSKKLAEQDKNGHPSQQRCHSCERKARVSHSRVVCQHCGYVSFRPLVQ